MSELPNYVLGQTATAARRLEIQDAHFAEASEKLLDDLRLKQADRVVELGCGAGSFSRRLLRRLGEGGVVVGVDAASGLLDQARQSLTGIGSARFETVLADIAKPGPWLDGADVVAARTMLHHVPMAEFALGRILAKLPPGVRLGFIEPDFRAPLAHVACLEANGRREVTPLMTWAMAINQLYQANRLSSAVGATLARALEMAGCRDVMSFIFECPSSDLTIENMLMFYDEVREQLAALSILSLSDIEEEQRRLRALPRDNLPPVWAIHCVTGRT